MYKSIGESTPPCLTPLEIENLLEREPFQRTPAFWSVYHASKTLTTAGGRFLRSNLLKRSKWSR